MYENMKQTLESLRENLESLEREEAPEQSVQHTPLQAEDLKQQLSAESALQGMMWAEVFGPPRAKKPFRWSHRSNNR